MYHYNKCFFNRYLSLSDLITDEISNMMDDYNNGKLDNFSFDKGARDAVMCIKNQIKKQADILEYTDETNKMLKNIYVLSREGAFNECDYYEGFFQGCVIAAKVLDMEKDFIDDLQSVVDKAAIYEKD